MAVSEECIDEIDHYEEVRIILFLKNSSLSGTFSFRLEYGGNKIYSIPWWKAWSVLTGGAKVWS